MFVVLTMLIIILEFILSALLILILSKASSNICLLDREITKVKKAIVPMVLDIRVSLRAINIQAKDIKMEQQSKQLLDIVNVLGLASFIFGLKKRKRL